MRYAAVIAIALALLGCGSGIQPMPEQPYDRDYYLDCVKAYKPEGWAATTDTHTFCKHAARQGATTGDTQP